MVARPMHGWFSAPIRESRRSHAKIIRYYLLGADLDVPFWDVCCQKSSTVCVLKRPLVPNFPSWPHVP